MNPVLTSYVSESHVKSRHRQDDVRKAMGFVDMSAGASQPATVVYPIFVQSWDNQEFTDIHWNFITSSVNSC